MAVGAIAMVLLLRIPCALTESLRESMRVLDRTLFQISREAVGSTVQEDMVELLRAVETNTAATAENNSLPSAGSNL